MPSYRGLRHALRGRGISGSLGRYGRGIKNLYGTTIKDVKALPKLRRDYTTALASIAKDNVDIFKLEKLGRSKSAKGLKKDLKKIQDIASKHEKDIRDIYIRHGKRLGGAAAAGSALGFGTKVYKARKRQASQTPRDRQYDVFPEYGYAAHGATKHIQPYYDGPYGGRERYKTPYVSEGEMTPIETWDNLIEKLSPEYKQKMKRIENDPRAKAKFDRTTRKAFRGHVAKKTLGSTAKGALGGALGGAAAGATAGTVVAPGLGTFIGGALGAKAGLAAGAAGGALYGAARGSRDVKNIKSKMRSDPKYRKKMIHRVKRQAADISDPNNRVINRLRNWKRSTDFPSESTVSRWDNLVESMYR